MNNYDELRVVPISDITVGVRGREAYGDIDELKESIERRGQISPIALRDLEDGTYELIAGGRRLTALTALGKPTALARLYPKELTEFELRDLELHENLDRLNLSWQEEAKMKKQLHDLHIEKEGPQIGSGGGVGWSITKTAAVLGEDVSNVRKELKLAEAMEVMPELAQAKSKYEAQKLLLAIEEKMIVEELGRREKEGRTAMPASTLLRELDAAYILGDFFDYAPGIPNASIDFAMVDPPYAIDLRAVKRTDEDNVAHYNEVDEAMYVPFLDKLCAELSRVLRPTGSLVMWFGPDPWFQIILDTMRRHNLMARGIPGIWAKPGSGQTNSPDKHLGSSYEMFFYAHKPEGCIKQRGRSNIFTFPPVSSEDKIHPTEKPIPLLEEIYKTFCHPGHIALVPFLGSGNDIFAARNYGVKAKGFDLSPHYQTLYRMRALELSQGGK